MTIAARTLMSAPRPPLTDAMRCSASSVSIVTAGRGERRTGATVTTALSLSIEPETMMVSINLRSSTFRAINEEGHYCVNILNSDQKDVAERFSGKQGLTGAERYAGSEWFALETGALALRGALASIDCWVEDIIRRHSHALVLGSVETIVMDVREKMPLTYSQGQYRSIT